jgi:hypothetical protein
LALLALTQGVRLHETNFFLIIFLPNAVVVFKTAKRNSHRPQDKHRKNPSPDNQNRKTMLGWINDCIEKLVLHKFDLDTWHTIKETAGLGHIKDGGFLKLETYPLKTTTDLVKAASDLSGLTVPQVYEVSKHWHDCHMIISQYIQLF